MTQVSRRKLDESILYKLFSLFFEAVGNNTTSQEFDDIVNDLLSLAEKIMLAKRVAIIYLLLKDKDVVAISQTLKVSTSTVSKFKYVKENSKGIVPRFNKIIKNEKLFNFLEDLFHDLFFPTFKPGTNWSQNLKNEWSRKKEKEIGL